MEFINEQILELNIPKIESLAIQPLQPSYLKALRIQHIIVSLIILACIVAGFFFFPMIRTPVPTILIILAWLMIFIPGWWFNVKSFHCLGYAIRQKDVIYKSGWIFQETSVCPFNRIQHCSVSSGPIDRKFGLATLRVYTAATEGDISIPGLLEAEAFSIKEFITQKIVTDEQPGN